MGGETLSSPSDGWAETPRVPGEGHHSRRTADATVFQLLQTGVYLDRVTTVPFLQEGPLGDTAGQRHNNEPGLSAADRGLIIR